MLNLNKLMIKFLFNSYDFLGATITTLISFLSNNTLNVTFILLTLGIKWIFFLQRRY